MARASQVASGTGGFYCSQRCNAYGRHGTPEERLWRNVPDRPSVGCWEWRGRLLRSGYAHISVNAKLELAHRVSWIFANGAIPDGLWVLHHCDNRRCVRPDHLFLGTRADNLSDMDSKGRRARGEKIARAKLTETGVREIRTRFASGERRIDLARHFGVSFGAISAVVSGETWKHVGSEGGAAQPYTSNLNRAQIAELPVNTSGEVSCTAPGDDCRDAQ